MDFPCQHSTRLRDLIDQKGIPGFQCIELSVAVMKYPAVGHDVVDQVMIFYARSPVVVWVTFFDGLHCIPTGKKFIFAYFIRIFVKITHFCPYDKSRLA